MALGPAPAAITIDQKGPVAGGDMTAGTSKVGRSQAEGVLLFSWGDASIQTAAKQAGIQRIHHVDNETLNILGIYARYETIVYGE
jgi:hypothetical protein